MRKLDFSAQIESVEDLRAFTSVYAFLRDDYHIEDMKTTLLVFDILKRIPENKLDLELWFGGKDNG